MPRITIDYTPALQQSAGIGRLTREVVRALLAIESRHRYTLFYMGGMGQRHKRTEDGRAVSSVVHTPSYAAWPLNDRWMYRIWHRARLPLPVEVLSGRCDLYHATDFVLPPTLPATRTVLTVHDLTFERDPDSAPPQLLRFLKRVVPQSARRATHIVADSYATARDLAELYAIAPDKITVIHSGVDERFRPDDALRRSTNGDTASLPSLASRYGIGTAPFILTVGTMQRRKNHLTLVRAFAELAGLPSIPSNLQLVIAGGKGWLYDDVAAEVTRQGLTERVKFIGFVDDDDLPALYRAAAVFAFPSLYEGFGIPPLEAMACGTPAVVSNASSLPEVVGDAGLMVDPLDVGALAMALHTAITDIHWRAQAVQRGLLRAQQFTWQRAAERLLGVYDAVVAGG
ncbi:MAG: glycosyltransferase family 4 protein [Chloroflexi bacterium]|nr:glycosyltransferase family 4 protein [Chloroflexota bacterium]